MALHIYEGPPGSGKSQGAMNKILDFLQKGYFVISTLEGHDDDECRQAIADRLKWDIDDLEDKLIYVPNEAFVRIEQTKRGTRLITNAYPIEEIYPVEYDDFSRLIKPGYALILDEAHEIYSKSLDFSIVLDKFFRKHRHFVDPQTGFCCEIILCTQSRRKIQPDLLDIVEFRSRFRKKKVTGQPDKYDIYFYEGDNTKPTHTQTHSYDAELFKMYKSHSLKNAVEDVDKNVSIYSSTTIKRTKFLLLLCLVIFILCIGYLGYSFTRSDVQPSVTPNASASHSNQSPQPLQPQQPQRPPAKNTPNTSSWRVIGSYYSNNLPVFIIEDSQGHIRYLTGSPFSRGIGQDVSIHIEGETITPYSNDQPTIGSVRSSNPPPQLLTPKF